MMNEKIIIGSVREEKEIIDMNNMMKEDDENYHDNH
jgi:hypothetical protein